MNQLPVLQRLLAHPFRAVLWLSILIIVLKAAVDGVKLHENFAISGNDDIMRLLTVRDWIAGQSWYDVNQYRFLPPEGLPLHWSRYIDVGIAAIIVPLSYFMPMDLAEQIVVAVWPTLILIITVLVIGFGTQRVFGRVPACFAVLCVTFWPLTADLHASPGNLDHHNVQLLMMVLLAFAVIWPNRPVAAGVVGGLAAAFSLAIGLEALAFIVGAGFTILIRAHFLPSHVSRTLLVAFCCVLVLGSVVLMMGQTAPSRWAYPVCDQLGLPTLAMVATAAIACTIPIAASRWLRTPVMQLGATVLLTAAGVALAWPMLAGCLDGPYGDLPLVIQEAISGSITEAKPGLVYARRHPGSTMVFLLPVVVSLLAGAALWLSALRSGRTRTHQDHALGLLLILCVVGTLMFLVQMRTVIMVASVVPVIGGIVIAHFLHGYLRNRDLGQGLLAIAIAAMITSPMLVIEPIAPLFLKNNGEGVVSRADCLAYDSLTSLNEVPPGVVLSHLNFGPSLVWATHHQGLAAPYHRSVAAMSNGILPFRMESAEMAAYTRASGATHLLLCRNYNYESDFVNTLATGGTADWLRPVVLSDDVQILFEVLPE